MPEYLLVLILLLTGFLLMFIEIVIIPGIGFAGILGTASLIYAGYAAFTQLSPAAGLLVTAVSILFLFLFIKIFPRTGIWKKIHLTLSADAAQGYQVSFPDYKKLPGKTGKTLTILHPGGTALIDGRRYDVTTDSEYIEKDEAITVVRVEGNRIFVSRKRTEV